MGAIEADNLRWYLESYFLWPVGVFKTRAEAIEKELPQWGQDLFQAALGPPASRKALTAWQQVAGGAEHRFSVEVDSDLPEGATAEAQATAREAATELLTLPWELLHDGRGWLFQGNRAVRVRRRLPNRRPQPTRSTGLPIRVLLLSPRPEQDAKGNPISYIDHRITARPLVEAVEGLGELVRLTVLAPPTYSALETALQQAADRHETFDVVHFDGHGFYDRRLGLGGLCSRTPRTPPSWTNALWSSSTQANWPGSSVTTGCRWYSSKRARRPRPRSTPRRRWPRLLEEGVTSVVAMSHSVLVETARRFVQAFYRSLAEGAPGGQGHVGRPAGPPCRHLARPDHGPAICGSKTGSCR